MFRLGLASDIHLDHLQYSNIIDFCQQINKTKLDGILITGDISNGKQIITHLEILSTNIVIPIYFCLGNHDFWTSSFEYIRKCLSELHKPNLHFLDTSSVLSLTQDTALIGHSGWYDGLNGDINHSGFFPNGMPEFRFVTNFIGLSRQDKKDKLIQLTTEAADILEKQLIEALKNHNTIYLGTHVPPYREASWFKGKISDEDGAPFFSNRIIGERLTKIMEQNKDKRLIVLCGHSHEEAFYKPIPNIDVYTASASYGSPSIYKTFQI